LGFTPLNTPGEHQVSPKHRLLFVLALIGSSFAESATVTYKDTVSRTIGTEAYALGKYSTTRTGNGGITIHDFPSFIVLPGASGYQIGPNSGMSLSAPNAGDMIALNDNSDANGEIASADYAGTAISTQISMTCAYVNSKATITYTKSSPSGTSNVYVGKGNHGDCFGTGSGDVSVDNAQHTAEGPSSIRSTVCVGWSGGSSALWICDKVSGPIQFYQLQ